MWKSDKIRSLFREKKHIPILYGIIIISVFFLAFSGKAPEKKEKPEKDMPATETLEAKLTAILADIEGVGKVSVALSYESTAEDVPIRDEDGEKSTAVRLGSGSGAEVAIRKSVMPRVRGVVVAAEGANAARVRAAILEAVTALTGTEAHQVAVFQKGR